MKNWFEITAKYVKVDDEGKDVKVAEVFLLDANTFTEAEASITGHLQEFIRGEFAVDKITKSRIIEVSEDTGDDYWWKAKISMVMIDEKAGKIKKVNEFFVVKANKIEDAITKLRAMLNFVLVPYEIDSMVVTNIVDVFPYVEK